MIERLVKSGNAYVEQDHVLFSVASMPDYGKLARRSLDEMIAGARVEVAPYKHAPMDFVLWKPSKPGEPAWPSPAGIAVPGRPGWHIECSAMSWRYLGEIFDIHGGGIDLVFPHHENEIAQSRCAFHTPMMANYWMHNGFLQVEGEKMSKSLGNFVTIQQLLNELPGDVIRFQMLMTHYRQPLDWTDSNVELARRELEEWSHLLNVRYALPNNRIPIRLMEELADDLNTPGGLAVLREQYISARKGGEEDWLEFAAGCKFLGFRELDKPGLFDFGVAALNVGSANLFKHSDTVERLRAAIANNAPEAVKSNLLSSIRQDGLDVQIDVRRGLITLILGDKETIERKVEKLVADRSAARARKDWKESDRIRDELARMGVVLKDTKDGTTWEIAR
jgi:cysteinyl-tRNA synthetase